MTKYQYASIDGYKIFYREAGSTPPTILLLHGFPTSSHMFRNLIPALADRYHVVAPDLHDPFFLPPGADAFKRDNPNAEVHFFDTGHFALETHAQEIATAIRDFLGRRLTRIAA